MTYAYPDMGDIDLYCSDKHHNHQAAQRHTNNCTLSVPWHLGHHLIRKENITEHINGYSPATNSIYSFMYGLVEAVILTEDQQHNQ